MSNREHVAARGDGIISKLKRIVSMWVEGATDGEISEALGEGWSRKTVKRYRQVLRLTNADDGNEKRGRWSDL